MVASITQIQSPLIFLLTQIKKYMIVNGYGAVGGMGIGRETEILGQNLSQSHLVNHTSQRTWPGIEPRLPQWESDD
jgi:hypothetical protein